ncbi:unnamed protein product [Periconia digitata]|uniref:DUF6594 domain-containing protein n=1 Tax=Periconia digitata TaxID=1303443 RepID=A0A9W4XEH2_9PLEO|nr:unnamed protein product [Periconia digitata]
MAEHASSTDSNMGENPPRLPVHPEPDSLDLFDCFSKHEEYFKEARNRPEIDIRPRHFLERNKRAKFYESKVRSRWRAVEILEIELKATRGPRSREQITAEWEIAMVELDKSLHKYSEINEQDTKAARARPVHKFIMDHMFRWFSDVDSRAPNAEQWESFGEAGGPVPRSYFALRAPENNGLHRLILRFLAAAEECCNNLQYRHNKSSGNNAKKQRKRLTGRTLELITNILECMIAAGCFAGAVIALYYIRSTRIKLIVVPFMSLVCAVPVSFLTKQSQGLFTLMAGIWAVLVVIVFLQAGNPSSVV